LTYTAGYTPKDNRADFGPIFPLPRYVLIILMVLQITLSDSPLV